MSFTNFWDWLHSSEAEWLIFSCIGCVLIIMLIIYIRHLITAITFKEKNFVRYDHIYLQKMRILGIILCIIQIPIEIPLLYNCNITVFISNILRILSHNIIFLVLIYIMSHTINVCNKIFKNITQLKKPNNKYYEYSHNQMLGSTSQQSSFVSKYLTSNNNTNNNGNHNNGLNTSISPYNTNSDTITIDDTYFEYANI